MECVHCSTSHVPKGAGEDATTYSAGAKANGNIHSQNELLRLSSEETDRQVDCERHADRQKANIQSKSEATTAQPERERVE